MRTFSLVGFGVGVLVGVDSGSGSWCHRIKEKRGRLANPVASCIVSLATAKQFALLAT